jgi:hypothetical protein
LIVWPGWRGVNLEVPGEFGVWKGGMRFVLEAGGNHVRIFDLPKEVHLNSPGILFPIQGYLGNGEKRSGGFSNVLRRLEI